MATAPWFPSSEQGLQSVGGMRPESIPERVGRARRAVRAARPATPKARGRVRDGRRQGGPVGLSHHESFPRLRLTCGRRRRTVASCRLGASAAFATRDLRGPFLPRESSMPRRSSCAPFRSVRQLPLPATRASIVGLARLPDAGQATEWRISSTRAWRTQAPVRKCRVGIRPIGMSLRSACRERRRSADTGPTRRQAQNPRTASVTRRGGGSPGAQVRVPLGSHPKRRR